MGDPCTSQILPEVARDVPVVLNAEAGTVAAGQSVEQRVRECFAKRGREARIVLAPPKEVERTIREAIAGTPPVLFVGGGDGTINTAARLVLGSSTALGVLPLGTRNHFARDLRLPLDLDEAVGALLEGAIVEVDVGEVNGQLFINNVSIGFYPQAVRRRQWNQERVGLSKPMAMLYAVLNVFWRYPMQTMTVRYQDQEERIHTPFVLIGNNEYTTGGEDIGRRATLCDGQLSVYYAHRVGRVRLFWAALKAVFGHAAEGPELQKILTESVTVTAGRHRRLDVAVDGEVKTMPHNLVLRARPRALRVIAPAPAMPS